MSPVFDKSKELRNQIGNYQFTATQRLVCGTWFYSEWVLSLYKGCTDRISRLAGPMQEIRKHGTMMLQAPGGGTEEDTEMRGEDKEATVNVTH